VELRGEGERLPDFAAFRALLAGVPYEERRTATPSPSAWIFVDLQMRIPVWDGPGNRFNGGWKTQVPAGLPRAAYGQPPAGSEDVADY